MIHFKIIRKYSGKSLFLLLLLAQFSCSDFLEVESREQVSDATLWQTSGNADLFLNNVYSGLPGPFNTYDPGENFTDNAMNGVNGTASRTLYANSVYTPSNTPNVWNLYNSIRAANLFITKATASQLPDDWKKLRIAEARFVRAYYYMLLWTNHGGVPIITDVLNQNEQGDEIFRARNTAEETYQFIVTECAAIANDLPATAQAGRASKGAALTLQGFCELYQASPLYNPSNDKAKWLQAAQTNKKVMDLASYTLFPNYETMLLEASNNNSEIIFTKQYLGGTSLGGGKEGLQGPWIVGGIQRAYGGVNPTQELVDEYAMANGLPISDPASGYDPQKPYTNREKRFYQSVIYDGAFWVDQEMVMKQGVGSRNATDLSNTNEATNTGYYLKKGLDPKYAVNGDHKLSSANFVIFRYAEVLLSYAEAQNEAVGPDASVYEAINAVRKRSELPALKAGLTQAQMRVAIHRERRIELAFEEKRWYDLMRLKLAEKNLNGSVHAMVIEQTGGKWVYKVVPAPDGARAFFANKNYLFPIPQNAIDRNSKLTQNPNY
ncbi:RagB/SusD family nutrient uptake outer membrane protein [Dyadobacter aurulentus]|uniref:RagB/SusD family nutrient uptake outer membrane protein n=1 Tax=Dyadobacter sp. UC 10 TaxID=2605428 RepID=UPI0011F2AE1F|nr:RagB/SusD family nutrient uptake outer membrane protein [Dyadobacter sp. UC 10]KAA0988908.1 RagB/SusD family nutrient uptake outer membrane protein [Dyadobacter sp. UC 10]